ncbi:MAG: agmatinase [Candidatus Methylomirabilales bacterium]
MSRTDPQRSVTLVGFPLDLTPCYRRGVKLGPDKIRWAGEAIEDYSLLLGRDVREVPVTDRGNLDLPPGDLQASLKLIEERATEILAVGTPLVALGGEHLVTLPLLRAAHQRYPDLVVLHLDAHADLADAFVGQRHTHGTVMRRATEFLGRQRIVQVGIRSADREEAEYAREWVHQFPGGPGNANQVRGLLEGRPVYVTLDLDLLDPAHAPGVSTPEPGGWTVRELLDFLAVLRGLDVVAMDLVELCPPYDPGDVTAIVAAKLLRDSLLLFFSERPARPLP